VTLGAVSHSALISRSPGSANKYDKAATRWLARLALETEDLQLRDIQRAAALRGPTRARNSEPATAARRPGDSRREDACPGED